MSNEPSAVALAAAIDAARMSPCAKSKRGAAVFEGDNVASTGFNGQPAPWRCEGLCRISAGPRKAHEVSACSMLCIHAEARAVRSAFSSPMLMRFDHLEPLSTLAGLDLVHIKVNEAGLPVPSGGPSCWQCSREIVDAGLDGVWLLLGDEHPRIHHVSINSRGDLEPGFARTLPYWRRYTAEKFHAETLLACGLIVSPPVAP